MWKEYKSTSLRSFQYDDEPELMHIIKGGHKDMYYVVFDSAYDDAGDFQIHTAASLLEKFHIDIN